MKEEKEYLEKYHIPNDANKFIGEFIVFFPDENNPTILFHTIIAEDAYNEAKKIEESTKKKPAVVRIPTVNNNIGQLISLRA